VDVQATIVHLTHSAPLFTELPEFGECSDMLSSVLSHLDSSLLQYFGGVRLPYHIWCTTVEAAAKPTYTHDAEPLL